MTWEQPKNEKFQFMPGVSFVTKEYTKNPESFFLLLIYNKKIMGRCLFIERGGDTYEIIGLKVAAPYQRKKLGSNLVEGINAYLLEHGKRGRLINAIRVHEIEDIDKRGLYKRHGWENILGTGELFFNEKRETIRSEIKFDKRGIL